MRVGADCEEFPQPRALRHGDVCGGTTIHGEPWGYTGLGPHQELTDAEGGQWPSGLLEVCGALRGAKRCIQLSPGSTEFSVATGVELAWEGAQVPRQEGGHPHWSCVVGLVLRVRREGRRAPRGQWESLREVKQGGDSQVCILEKYFDVSGEQTRAGGRTVRNPVCLSALGPPLPHWGVRSEGEAGGELTPRKRESNTPKAGFPGECSPQAPHVTRARITLNPGSLAP